MFDKIVCLNLDKRINEQERIRDEFQKHHLDIEFFVAGDGHLLPAYKYNHIDIVPTASRYGYPAWVNRPNSYNAYLCFRKIIREAKYSQLRSITLVEDDCTLQDHFSDTLKIVQEELQSVPKWDMLYCCSCHAWTKTKSLSNHILKLQGSGGFQFVTIRDNLFDTFLLSKMTMPIDAFAGTLHNTFNCYATWPNLAIPKPGYSYCEGTTYDNTKLYSIKGC